MSKIFVRERRNVGEGAGQPRFRVVAAYQTDLDVFVPHLRRVELEQLAAATGAEVVYLSRGDQDGEGEGGGGQGGRHRAGRLRGRKRLNS